MGISCQIIRNGKKIERVLTPKGTDSNLYKSALEEVNDPSLALKIWATAYIPEFKLYYGDWTREGEEPSLSAVSEYLEARQGIAPPMTDQDISDMRSLMIGNKIKTADELNAALDPFIRRGAVEVNRENLMKSGLYSVDEINRILENPKAKEDLEGLISRFNSMMLYGMDARMTYLFTSDYDGDVYFMSNEYSASGKKQFISPAKIDSELRERVGGIKTRNEFDAAMESFPYDAVSERYFSDQAYADRLFNYYSRFTRLNVVDSSGENVRNSERRNLLSFTSGFNEKVSGEMLEDVNALIEMPSELWEDEDLVKEGLRKIALAGADMGIDLTGLENQYYNKSKEEFDDFLLGLDLYLRSLRPGREYYESFSEDYDNFFGKGEVKQDLAILRPGEDNLNVSIMEPSYRSDVEIYENASMIHLHDNVYQKVAKMPKEKLYDTLYEMAMIDPRVLPSDAYPGTSGKATGHPKEAVIRSIKEYVLKHTDYNQSEEITLNKLIFGHPLNEVKPKQDIQRDLNRYMERKNRNRSVNAFGLRSKLLRAQILNPQLYNNTLYNIVHENGGFSLKNSDPMTLRELDLALPEEIKDLLYDYAIHSSDPSMRDLFFIKDYPDICKSVDFYLNYYRNNPEAIKDMTFAYAEVPGHDNLIKTVAVDDVIRVRDVIYQKVAEDGGYSIYEAYMDVKDNSNGLIDNVDRVSGEAIVLNQYNKATVETETDMIEYDSFAKENEIEKIKEQRTCG